MEILVTDEGSPPVEDEVARVLLFRAVRELAINAATHAGVRTVTVRLGRIAWSVLVTVEDRGCGFDVEDREAHGYGLFGIREQLRSVGGTMQLVSKLGEGTSVTLSVAVAGSLRAQLRSSRRADRCFCRFQLDWRCPSMPTPRDKRGATLSLSLGRELCVRCRAPHPRFWPTRP